MKNLIMFLVALLFAIYCVYLTTSSEIEILYSKTPEMPVTSPLSNY